MLDIAFSEHADQRVSPTSFEQSEPVDISDGA